MGAERLPPARVHEHTLWSARKECHRTLEDALVVLPWVTCALSKRLGSCILGKDYWRRAAIFTKNCSTFTEKVNHGQDSRYDPSFVLGWWGLARIPQPTHTWCPRHMETVRNLHIVKLRWPCMPQGSHLGKVSIYPYAGLWPSPHFLWSLVRTQPDLWSSSGNLISWLAVTVGGEPCPSPRVVLASPAHT